MNNQSDTTAEKIRAMLGVMWQKNRSTLEQRLQTLRDAKHKLIEGSLDRVVRKDAESAAHKLAGVLGTFDLPEGSALASKIEVLMAQDEGINSQQQQLFGMWLDELERQIVSRDQ